MSGFNLSDWALRHRSVAIYLMILAVAAGLFSYYRLGRNEDPAFVIKTMVVQAAWPGATIDDTLKQVTERLERKLQETPQPRLHPQLHARRRDDDLRQSEGQRDGRRKCRTSGITSARASATSAATLPAGVIGPGFNDDFGDTFGIIYGFTADGFSQRELRDYVEDVRSKLLQRAGRLEDRDPRRAGRADLRRIFDARSSPISGSTAPR